MPMLLACLVAAPALAVDGDGDGLQDEWESAHFGNLKETATGDFDGDGLNNLAEYKAGTDPTQKDTDLDKLSDFEELFPKGAVPVSSPIKADTDGDFCSMAKKCLFSRRIRPTRTPMAMACRTTLNCK